MIAIAAIGGILLEKMKMPLGYMVGAMIAVAIYNVFTGLASYPSSLKLAMQIIIGSCIGCKVGMDQVRQLRKAWFPTLVVCISTTAFTLLFGMIVYKVTNFDLPTAMFSIAPGGAADMAIVSSAYGANEAYVSIVNTLRLIFNVSIFLPITLGILQKKEENTEDKYVHSKAKVEFNLKYYIKIIVLFAVGTVGGILFDRVLHVSAGGIIGSMIISAVFCCCTDIVVMPKWITASKQIIQGGYSGSLITMAVVLLAKELILPLVIEIIFILTYTLVTAFILIKFGKRRTKFSVIVPTPGGIGEIAAVSDALGEDTPTIVVVQTVRLFFVLSVLPLIIPLFL